MAPVGEVAAVKMLAGGVNVHAEVAQSKGVMISEKARMLPMSPLKKSCAPSIHVPLPFKLSKADSGLAGVKEPVNGAWPLTTLWMEPPADSSSSKVLQKLLPLSPVLSMSFTVVPFGAFRTISKSLTKV